NNSMATRLVGKSGNIFAWCYCSYDAIGNESAALRPFKSCVLAAVCPGRIVDSRAPPRMSTFVALHSHALGVKPAVALFGVHWLVCTYHTGQESRDSYTYIRDHGVRGKLVFRISGQCRAKKSVCTSAHCFLCHRQPDFAS